MDFKGKAKWDAWNAKKGENEFVTNRNVRHENVTQRAQRGGVLAKCCP